MKLSKVLHDVNPTIGFPFDTHSENYPHPFCQLEKLEMEIDKYNKEDFFNKTYSCHRAIHRETQKALFNFQYEINLCPRNIRAEYANSIIAQLLFIYRRIDKKNLKKNSNKSMKTVEVVFNKNYFPLYLFLLDALKICFETILEKYETELSKEETKEISEILSPQEPLLSFQLSRDISDKDLEDSFKRRLIDKELIHQKTEFSTFKNLFLNKPLDEKIEWISTLGALYYFINQLVKKDMKGKSAVVDPNNTHWKITSEFFTYNRGKRIPNLKHHKTPRQELKNPIEQFVSDLKSL